MKKTLAIRLLEQKGLPYRVVEYTYDPENLDVKKIADENDLPLQKIFKTLVVEGNKTGLLVALIPGHQQLDRKALAKASGNKKINLLPIAKLEDATGYIRGGCSPLGMKSPLPTYIDQSADNLGKIWVNAGIRGLLMEIQTIDLVKLSQGKLVEMAAEEDSSH